MPMTKLCTKPTTMKPGDVADARRVDLGELLAAVPADGQQQVDRQALVDHVGELELHPEDRDQEPQVEEQQQRLEQVVPEVVPELMKHWS